MQHTSYLYTSLKKSLLIHLSTFLHFTSFQYEIPSLVQGLVKDDFLLDVLHFLVALHFTRWNFQINKTRFLCKLPTIGWLEHTRNKISRAPMKLIASFTITNREIMKYLLDEATTNFFSNINDSCLYNVHCNMERKLIRHLTIITASNPWTRSWHY